MFLAHGRFGFSERKGSIEPKAHYERCGYAANLPRMSDIPARSAEIRASCESTSVHTVMRPNFPTRRRGDDVSRPRNVIALLISRLFTDPSKKLIGFATTALIPNEMRLQNAAMSTSVFKMPTAPYEIN